MNVWHRELKSQPGNPLWLVGVSGRLDQSLTPDLERTLQGLLHEGHEQLIVDLSDTSYINSGGLRCLVVAWRQARQRGGNLVLTGLNRRLHDVFTMVGFHKVFEIFPTSDEARQAFP